MTRTYDDRLETLKNVAKAGISVCCGGILGMGETLEQRVAEVMERGALVTDEIVGRMKEAGIRICSLSLDGEPMTIDGKVIPADQN